jgi:AcrR family transcriptional regulator
MKENPDRRVRKTKRQLRNAMISLMEEKSIAEITVREIADLADINRGTFYLHYRDVNDLVEQVENEIISEFQSVINARTLEELRDNTALIFEDVFTYMAENAALCSALLSPHGDISFLQRLKDIVKEKCYHNWDAWYNKEKSCYFNTFSTFLVAGCIGVIQEWLHGGREQTPKEMALTVHDIILRGPAMLK